MKEIAIKYVTSSGKAKEIAVIGYSIEEVEHSFRARLDEVWNDRNRVYLKEFDFRGKQLKTTDFLDIGDYSTKYMKPVFYQISEMTNEGVDEVVEPINYTNKIKFLKDRRWKQGSHPSYWIQPYTNDVYILDEAYDCALSLEVAEAEARFGSGIVDITPEEN